MFDFEITEERVAAMLMAGFCERKQLTGKDLKKVFIIIMSEPSSQIAPLVRNPSRYHCVAGDDAPVHESKATQQQDNI
jgi:hypothetical protein